MNEPQKPLFSRRFKVNQKISESTQGTPQETQRDTRHKRKIIIGILGLGIFGFLILITIKVFGPSERIPKKVPIEFDFLLRPFFQAKPRVFVNGEWKELPNSQNSMLSPNGDKLVVCGEGGLYIYDLLSNTIEYIYSIDWYPCDKILFVNKNTLIVEKLFSKDVFSRDFFIERLSFDIPERKIINREIIPEKEAKKPEDSVCEYIHHLDGFQRDFNKICNEDRSLCAQLNNDNTVALVDKDQKVKPTNIEDAIALVGFKNNVLFFATFARAHPLNHHLYAYDIHKGVSENLLTHFRYDYELMAFAEYPKHRQQEEEEITLSELPYATKDRETYTNKDFGFEIKYPADWWAIANIINDSSNWGYKIIFTYSEPHEQDFKSITVAATTEHPFLPYFDMDTAPTNRLIAGLPTYQEESPGYCSYEGGALPYTALWIKHNNYFYTIIFHNTIDIMDSLNQQILSSFKLLEDIENMSI